MPKKQNHSLKYVEPVGTVENLFGDNIAVITKWDFSRANLNHDSRIETITKVASVCYDNPAVVGKEALYNRLKAEAIGLPSSSFEFVPVLLHSNIIESIFNDAAFENNEDNVYCVERYGEYITTQDLYNRKGNGRYLLTNFRALLADCERLELDSADFFNTEEECKIIAKYSTTFLCKMDLVTARQHNRHRVSLQELSRRYVSGRKTEFEFYLSPKMKDFVSEHYDDDSDLYFNQENINDILVDRYFQALDAGVKEEEARRTLPQSMYTTIWTTFLPFQLKNYIALRTDSHAQAEIQLIAKAMQSLIGENHESTQSQKT